jgi:hypothetical protein
VDLLGLHEHVITPPLPGPHGVLVVVDAGPVKVGVVEREDDVQLGAPGQHLLGEEDV